MSKPYHFNSNDNPSAPSVTVDDSMVFPVYKHFPKALVQPNTYLMQFQVVLHLLLGSVYALLLALSFVR